MSIALPSLKDTEIDFTDLQLTDEEIEAISNIEKIELGDYSPYHSIDSDDILYRVTFRDGTIREYVDTRQLYNEYGKIADYIKEKFELPYIYNAGYDYTHPDQPPWWR